MRAGSLADRRRAAPRTGAGLPAWLGAGRGSNHGSPFSYDTHVPLIFWRSPALVRRRIYQGEAAMQNTAPTLALLLGVARPSGTSGRALS